MFHLNTSSSIGLNLSSPFHIPLLVTIGLFVNEDNTSSYDNFDEFYRIDWNYVVNSVPLVDVVCTSFDVVYHTMMFLFVIGHLSEVNA